MWHLFEDPCPFLFPNDFPTQKLPNRCWGPKLLGHASRQGQMDGFSFPFWWNGCVFMDESRHNFPYENILLCVFFFLCVFEGMMFFSSGDRGILRKQNAGIIFWSPEAIACWSFRMYRTHAYRDVRVFFCIRICHMFACTYILCKYTLGCSFSH